LRFFHHSKEWDLITINKEYPITNYINYFSEKENILIAIQSDYINPVVGLEIKTDYPVIEWDLVHKKNRIIGYLKNSNLIKPKLRIRKNSLISFPNS
jgi:hypothetical protein